MSGDGGKQHHDRFCDECGVSRDLHHDAADPEPWDCEAADAKARFMDDFFRPFSPLAASVPSTHTPGGE